MCQTDIEKLLENDSVSISEARKVIFWETAAGSLRGLGEPSPASASFGISVIAPLGDEGTFFKPEGFRDKVVDTED